MRISTHQLAQLGVNAMLDTQAVLSKTQLQLSTGKTALTPADDPTAATETLNLEQSSALTTQYQSNIRSATDRLSLTDQTLGDFNGGLQRIRELTLQANSGALSAENRKSIAEEVRQRFDDLLSMANTQDANHEYIFAGFQGATQPFSKNATTGGVDYSGDEGQRFVQIGPTRQIAVSDSGTPLFRSIPNGNGTFVTAATAGNAGSAKINVGVVSGTFAPDNYTLTMTQLLPTDPVSYTVKNAVGATVTTGFYTDGGDITFQGAKIQITGTPLNGDTFTVKPSAHQDIFTVVKTLATALDTPITDNAARTRFTDAMATALKDLDYEMGTATDARAVVGARLNAVSSQKDINDGFQLQLQQTLSNLNSLDYAEAASRLNQQLLGLQAAQQAFAKIQGLSLFNYLR